MAKSNCSGVRGRRLVGAWLCIGLFLSMPLVASASNDAAATPTLGAISQLPPGEQYRQLSLLLLLANGADAELLEFLAVEQGTGVASLGDTAQALQQYPTPLARIADPGSMLRGAGEMMHFAQQNRVAIEQELERIRQTWPILVSMIDMDTVLEDAIIIRSAVADSLQYQHTEAGDAAVSDTSLLAYRGETLRQRNAMEYLQFQQELDGITDTALDDLSYKLDAFQRMADDEMDPELLRERIEAAEDMNEETRQRYREQAYVRASTLYLLLIPALVTVATD